MTTIIADIYHDTASGQSSNESQSTILYDQMPKILPIEVMRDIWIGPIASLEYFYSSISHGRNLPILNLTSEQLIGDNICNVQMSSVSFQHFLQNVKPIIEFLENNNHGYICCRNGYSRALVAVAIYKIYKHMDFSKLLNYYYNLLVYQLYHFYLVRII